MSRVVGSTLVRCSSSNRTMASLRLQLWHGGEFSGNDNRRCTATQLQELPLIYTDIERVWECEGGAEEVVSSRIESSRPAVAWCSLLGIRESRLGGTVRSNGVLDPRTASAPCSCCVLTKTPSIQNQQTIDQWPASASQRPSAALSSGPRRRMIRNGGRGRKERLQISDVGDRAETSVGNKETKK